MPPWEHDDRTAAAGVPRARPTDGEQSTSPTASALRRVAGLSTELDDVTEVEYRQLRLERVVLVGVWTEGTVEDAENSPRRARRARRDGGLRACSTA